MCYGAIVTYMELQTQENFRPPESDDMAEMQRTMTSLTKDQLKAVKLLAAELDVPVSVVMRALISHSLDLLGASDAGIRRALDAAVAAATAPMSGIAVCRNRAE